jgi:hypothetical protein
MTPPDMNDPLESELRQAFRSVDPPAGFADRVLQRAAHGTARTSIGRGPMLWWATAAALIIVVSGVSGGLWYRAEEHRRAEGEEARRQVLLSLEITSAKLRAVQMKINHQGESHQ